MQLARPRLVTWGSGRPSIPQAASRRRSISCHLLQRPPPGARWPSCNWPACRGVANYHLTGPQHTVHSSLCDNGSKRHGVIIRASDASSPTPDGTVAERAAAIEKLATSLTYFDAQKELRKRGIPANGKKAEVAEKLRQALLKEEGISVAEAAADEAGGAVGGGESRSTGFPSKEEIQLMSYKDLQKKLVEYGIPHLGKKVLLQQRMEDYIAQKLGQPTPTRALEPAMQPTDSPPTEAAGQGDVDVRDSSQVDEAPPGSDEDQSAFGKDDELPQDLEGVMEELMGLTEQELQEALEDKGVNTAGTKEQLARRLTLIMSQEDLQDDGEVADMQDSADAFILTAEQRRKLLQDMTARQQEEYQGWTRPQLFQELRAAVEPGVEVVYSNKDSLAQRLAALKSEAALAGLQAAAESGDATATAQLQAQLQELTSSGKAEEAVEVEKELEAATTSPADNDVLRMNTTEIRGLRIAEVKAGLRLFNIDPGNRNAYQLKDMLVAAVLDYKGKGKPPAEASPEKGIFERVHVLNLTSLRSELSQRGLVTSGSKAELRSRLVEALTKEEQVNVPRVRPGKEEQDEDNEEEAAPRPYNYRLVHSDDPPIRIAVVCGAPGGTVVQADASLAATRALFDHLHTASLGNTPNGTSLEYLAMKQELTELEKADAELNANLMADLYGDEEASEQAVTVDASSSQKAGTEAEAQPADRLMDGPSAQGGDALARFEQGERGATVDIYYVNSVGRAFAVTSAQLLGLAGGCESLENSVLLWPHLSSDLPELVEHLKDNVQAVLPVLVEPPTGAHNNKHGTQQSFTAMLEVAGVPYVGTPVPQAAVASNKCRLFERLQQLDYPVLPSYRIDANPSSPGTWMDGFIAWCKVQGWDMELQLLVAKPADGTNGVGVTPARGVLRAAQAAAALLGEPLWEAPEGGPAVPMGGAQGEATASTAGAATPADEMPSALPAAALAMPEADDDVPQLYDAKDDEPEGLAGFGRFPYGSDVAVGVSAAPDDAMDVEQVQEGADLAPLPRTPYTLDSVAAEMETKKVALTEPATTVLVEPWMRRPAVEFSCVVIEGDDGPVALMPTEVEIYDAHSILAESRVASATWAMMQNGASPQEIERTAAEMSAAEPHPLYHTFNADRTYLPQQVVKYHSPPRLSRVMVHHIRHAAARLFQELGLRDVARMDGWVDLEPDWQEAHKLDEFAVRTLPDHEPHLLIRLMEEKNTHAERRDAQQVPLDHYFAGPVADLSRFDAGQRLRAEYNGEGTVLFTDVNTAGLAMDAGIGRALMFHQAAEVGIPPSTLIRNLVNGAMRRAGVSPDLQLPPTPPTLREGCATLMLTDSSPLPEDEEVIARVVRQDALLDEIDDIEADLLIEQYDLEDAIVERRRDLANAPIIEEAQNDLIDAMRKGDEEAGWAAMDTLIALDTDGPMEWFPEFDERPMSEKNQELLAARAAREEMEAGLTDEEVMTLRLGYFATPWRSDWQDVVVTPESDKENADGEEGNAEGGEEEDPLPTRHPGAGHEHIAPSAAEQAAAGSTSHAPRDLEAGEAELADDDEAVRPGETDEEARWRVWSVRDARRLAASEARREQAQEIAYLDTMSEFLEDTAQEAAAEGDGSLQEELDTLRLLARQAEQGREAYAHQVVREAHAKLEQMAEVNGFEEAQFQVIEAEREERLRKRLEGILREENPELAAQLSEDEELLARARISEEGEVVLCSAAEAQGEEEEQEQGGEDEYDLAAASLAAGTDGFADEEADEDTGEAEGEWVQVEEDEEEDDPPAAEPGVQRVWLLMGGGGDARAASLASGANIYSKLAKYSDIMVEPFLLAPNGGGLDDQRRRAILLQRRNERLSIGLQDASGPGWSMAEGEEEEAEAAVTGDSTSFYDGTEEDVAVSTNPSNKLSGPYRLPNLLNMAPMETSLESEHVWALPPAAMMRPSVNEVQEYCERALREANTSVLAMTPLQRQAWTVRAEVQEELAASGVEGVGCLWGPLAEAPEVGDHAARPTPPRLLNLEEFVKEACGCGATVLIALRGGGIGSLGEGGHIQAFLDSYNVPFTGPGTATCLACTDKLVLADVLGDLEELGVTVPPREPFDSGELLRTTKTVRACRRVLRLLRGLLGVEEDTAVCIKPASGAAHVGVARLDVGEDLFAYTQALRKQAPYIPAGTLSTPHGDVPMPQFPPSDFFVEPYVESESVLVLPPLEEGDEASPAQGAGDSIPSGAGAHRSASSRSRRADGSVADRVVVTRKGEAAPAALAVSDGQPRVQRSGVSDWVEVAISLMGNTPSMTVLPISLKAQVPSGGTPPESCGTLWLTPPPESVVPAKVLEAASERAGFVAERLASRGILQIDAFLHVGTGELVVIDVDVTPDMSETSIIFQQALAVPSGPVYPDEVLRSMVALTTEAQAIAAEASSTIDDDNVGDELYNEGGDGDGGGGDGDLLEELEQIRMGPGSGGVAGGEGSEGMYEGGVWDADAYGGGADGDGDGGGEAEMAGSWSQM